MVVVCVTKPDIIVKTASVMLAFIDDTTFNTEIITILQRKTN